MLRIYRGYTRAHRKQFALGLAGSVLATIVQGMIPPLIVADLFSKLQVDYSKHEHLRFAAFESYFILFAAAMFVGALLWRLQSYYIWQLEIEVRRDISNDVYDHLQAQSQRFHADRFGGALVSQANRFISAYERLVDDFIWMIMPGITTIVVAIAVLAVVSWPYAVAMFVLITLYLLVMSRRVAKQMPFNVAQAKSESAQTAALADAVTNNSTIRAFAREDYESARFRGVTANQVRTFQKLSVENFKTEALSHFQTNGFQVLALLAGLVAVTTYGTSVSLLYLVISYSQNIVSQLWQFGRTVRSVNRSIGDAAEMTDILGIEPEIVDPQAVPAFTVIHGEVKFEDVVFAYPGREDAPLFNGLSFRVKSGEKVGLVGPSGGGKTTITSLLLRFSDIQGGAITVDGRNIAGVSQHELRSHIAYVSQEPILFHRSLAENIGYGELDATPQVIEGVAKMANAHEFIAKLPEGYETLVGERGIKLSGGQRQRVVIARAMLKNAPILVLDEATSALDSESEVLIQAALWRLMEGRTAIVIAHRLSTIQHMDRIIVLENGEIAEQGSHKELMHNQGVYARLWTHQSGGFLEV